MLVTCYTRRALAYRRAVRDLRRDGWEHVGDNGGKLWELHRGCRQDHEIVACCIGPDNKTLWVKTKRKDKKAVKHARTDYDRIQDPANKIADDEPVMLFRAQDAHFIRVLEYYRQLIQAANGDLNIERAIDRHIERALEWRKTNAVKEPDMSREHVAEYKTP